MRALASTPYESRFLPLASGAAGKALGDMPKATSAEEAAEAAAEAADEGAATAADEGTTEAADEGTTTKADEAET